MVKIGPAVWPLAALKHKKAQTINTSPLRGGHHPWTDRHAIWGTEWRPERNHPCQILCQSVEGFFPWQQTQKCYFLYFFERPLQQFCTVVQTVISVSLCLAVVSGSSAVPGGGRPVRPHHLASPSRRHWWQCLKLCAIFSVYTRREPFAFKKRIFAHVENAATHWWKWKMYRFNVELEGYTNSFTIPIIFPVQMEKWNSHSTFSTLLWQWYLTLLMV